MNIREILETRLVYPTPDLISPYAEAIQKHTDKEWIDGELRSLLPDAARENYKRVRTGYMSARWWPLIPTYERLIPLARLMLWSMYNDDIYEQCTPDEVRNAQECTVAILKGTLSASDANIPLGAFLEQMRHGFLEFIPHSSVVRIADKINIYFDGVEIETMFKRDKRFPTPENQRTIREKTLMLRAFNESMEVETGVTLPDKIHRHPVIRELSRVSGRIPGYFNDIQSLLKEEATGDFYVNLVKVLENFKGITRAEAIDEVIRINNEDVNEFLYLQKNLPDFGVWQQDVEYYVHCLSMPFNGWKSATLIESDRYWKDGYNAPEVFEAAANIVPDVP
ncbi:terpene synthase family protein [Chryseobacterium lathyri]|uniref:terpene synthase family protein n=1 Tax=Chryseobacterium lathyri TaxID=395933 RepID=UPI00278205EE|nr:hypothetical protein [Chryseobacterium lathyri]MDQ0065174.1 hypothetical protein [Chryseobacterium lathyri]